MKNKQGDPIKIDILNISEPTSRVDDMPEVKLWRAVIQQIVIDTTDHDANVRAQVLDYINSPAILDAMDFAAIDRSKVHALRSFCNSGKSIQFRTESFGRKAA